MNEERGVSRKNVKVDRIAICPKYGCEYMTRVKPLKFRFFGFGKHPKCNKHHLHLIYVDEMIGNFTDAALACFFDKSALPPSELIEEIRLKFPQEIKLFIRGWVYCITIGRGAPIVSGYMDGISNGYLKQLSRKQKKVLRKTDDGNSDKISRAIKDGLKEITNQYTRLLKHLRIHSEILNDHQKLKSLSKSLRNFLNEWQKSILKNIEVLNKSENMREMSLQEIKRNYDEILNVGTCRCLLGLNPESKEIKKAGVTAFDRFSAYEEFYLEGITDKFTKSDLNKLETSIGSNNQFHNNGSELENKNTVSLLNYYNKNHPFTCKNNEKRGNTKAQDETNVSCKLQDSSINDSSFNTVIPYNKLEQIIQDYFSDDFAFLTSKEISLIRKGYFNNVSLDELMLVIEIYSMYTHDSETLILSKAEFIKEMGNALYPYFEEVRGIHDSRSRGLGFTDEKLFKFLELKPRFRTGKCVSQANSRQIFKVLKLKVQQNKKAYKKAISVLGRLKSGKILRTRHDKLRERQEYTHLTESLVDLYSFCANKPIFTTNFSNLLFGKETAMKQEQCKSSRATCRFGRYAIEQIEKYLRIEYKIFKLKIDNEHNIISDLGRFNLFKRLAIALIRWFYLEQDYVSKTSVIEASILFNTMFLNHRENRDIFWGDLNRIFNKNYSSNYHDVLRGNWHLGIKSLNKIRKNLTDIPPSSLKKKTLYLMREYLDKFMNKGVLRGFTVGTLAHRNIEFCSEMELSSRNGLRYDSEKFSNYPQSLHKMDFWIKKSPSVAKILDLNCLSIKNGLDLSKIDEVAFDFTMVSVTDYRHALKKVKKFYQKRNRLLFIVIYGGSAEALKNLKRELKLLENVPFRSQVFVITIKNYLKLLNFSSEIAALILKVSRLSWKALTDNSALKYLINFNPNQFRSLDNFFDS